METKKIREAILQGSKFKVSDSWSQEGTFSLYTNYSWTNYITRDNLFFVNVSKINDYGIYWYCWVFNKRVEGFLRFSNLLLLNKDGSIMNPKNNVPL